MSPRKLNSGKSNSIININKESKERKFSVNLNWNRNNGYEEKKNGENHKNSTSNNSGGCESSKISSYSPNKLKERDLNL